MLTLIWAFSKSQPFAGGGSYLQFVKNVLCGEHNKAKHSNKRRSACIYTTTEGLLRRTKQASLQVWAPAWPWADMASNPPHGPKGRFRTGAPSYRVRIGMCASRAANRRPHALTYQRRLIQSITLDNKTELWKVTYIPLQSSGTERRQENDAFRFSSVSHFYYIVLDSQTFTSYQVLIAGN